MYTSLHIDAGVVYLYSFFVLSLGEKGVFLMINSCIANSLGCNRVCAAFSYLVFFFFLAGYAFVYFEDERDAEDAIRGIDNTPFGYEKRKLSVEWAKVSLSSFSNEIIFSDFVFCRKL